MIYLLLVLNMAQAEVAVSKGCDACEVKQSACLVEVNQNHAGPQVKDEVYCRTEYSECSKKNECKQIKKQIRVKAKSKKK